MIMRVKAHMPTILAQAADMCDSVQALQLLQVPTQTKDPLLRPRGRCWHCCRASPTAEDAPRLLSARRLRRASVSKAWTGEHCMSAVHAAPSGKCWHCCRASLPAMDAPVPLSARCEMACNNPCSLRQEAETTGTVKCLSHAARLCRCLQAWQNNACAAQLQPWQKPGALACELYSRSVLVPTCIVLHGRPS